MNKEEMLQVIGGASLSGTLVSAISKIINSVLEVGRSLGTAIRRTSSNKLCSY